MLACVLQYMYVSSHRDRFNVSLATDVVLKGEISESSCSSVLPPSRFSKEIRLFVLSMLKIEFVFIPPMQEELGSDEMKSIEA